MDPELTIVVPTYRRPEKLGRALGSVPDAVSRSHEVIVIDDCPDGSGFSVAQRHGARYICKAGTDRGLSASRNMGLGIARGRWITFLDDDDFFAPQGLDKLLAKGQVERGIIFGDYAVFNHEVRTDIDLSAVDLNALLVFNRIPVGAYILERGAIVERFDTRLRSHEDWNFLLIHTASNRLCHVPGVVAFIDKTEGQSTSMLARRRKLAWLDHLSIWARFPASHLSLERANLLQTLGVHLAEEMLRFEDEI